MNIFSTEQGFIGEDGFVACHNVFQEFLTQARSIRRKLGKKAYKLDEYIRRLLIACTYSIEDDFSTLSKNVASPIYSACRAITFPQSGEEVKTPQSDIGKACLAAVKAGEEKLSAAYQEMLTRYRICYCHFVDQLLEPCVDKAVYDIWNDLDIDIDSIAVTELYKEICECLGGEEDMEKLNDLFAARFLAVPMRHIAYQFAANDLAMILLERDPETSKETLRLLLEDE